MNMKALLVIGLGLLLAQQTLAQAPVHPLSRILLNLEEMPKAKVIEVAKQQSMKQWEMEKGPLFASTPEVNNDPKKVSQEAVFDGFFLAKSAKTKLAIFSDDGCDVSIDNKQVLKNFSKGQHLPSVEKESLHFLEFKFEAGRTYHVRVRYSNTIFLGPTDIDGCTLFAFDDGGMAPEANINADFNRDGDVNATDDTQKLKTQVGVVVVRNQEKVYEDGKEPARRREVKVGLKGGAKGKIVVSRKADKELLKEIKGAAEKLNNNLKLFKDRSGGEDLFPKGKNGVPAGEVSLEAGSYWLEGGPDASELVRDLLLSVRLDQSKAVVTDEIRATVLWVNLTGITEGKLPNAPVFDGHKFALQATGHTDLGFHRSTADSTDGTTSVSGEILLRGDLLPRNLTRNNLANNATITTGFARPKDRFAQASAAYGFVFRRFITGKSYFNGQSKEIEFLKMAADDSFRGFQDVDPDFDKNIGQPVIADNDGPTTFVVREEKRFFACRRLNFVQHVAFYFEEDKPERCSAMLNWSASMDIALSSEKGDKALFIRSKPNEKDAVTNILKVGPKSHIGLELGLDVPILEKVENPDDGKKPILHQAKEQSIILHGKHLIGRVFILKGDKVIKTASSILAEPQEKNPTYSALTKLFVAFPPIDAPVGNDYEVGILNAAGEAKLKIGIAK